MLREQGDEAEAERVQSGPFAESLIALRTPAETDAAFDQRIEAIFAVERERVANAAVLAELLAPILAARLPLAAPPVAPESLDSRPVARVTRPLPIAPAGIADFIDEMIAQERTNATPPAAHRRAS